MIFDLIWCSIFDGIESLVVMFTFVPSGENVIHLFVADCQLITIWPADLADWTRLDVASVGQAIRNTFKVVIILYYRISNHVSRIQSLFLYWN